LVPMGERAGLAIILINGGRTGSGLKGTPVGSSISSGRTTSCWRKNRKEGIPSVRHLLGENIIVEVKNRKEGIPSVRNCPGILFAPLWVGEAKRKAQNERKQQ